MEGKQKKTGILQHIIFVVMAVMMVLTTGCGDSVSNEDSQETEIRVWEDDGIYVDVTWDKIFTQFEKENPGIKIISTHYEVSNLAQSYENAISSGGTGSPYLVITQSKSLGSIVSSNAAAALDDFLSKEWLDTLDSDSVQSCRVNDKLYAVPTRVGNCLTLLRNKNLSSGAPATLDELSAISRTVMNSTNNSGKYGLDFNQNDPMCVLPLVEGFGGNILDENGNIQLDTDPMKKAINLLYGYKYVSKIVPPEVMTEDNVAALFKRGKIVFAFDGPWDYSKYKDTILNYTTSPLPKTSDGKDCTPYKSTEALVINPNIPDQHKDAVKKLIEFINNKDNQISMSKATFDIPTNSEAKQDKTLTADQLFKATQSQLKIAKFIPINKNFSIAIDSIKPVFSKVMDGTTEPQDAPIQMQKLAEEAIKK